MKKKDAELEMMKETKEIKETEQTEDKASKKFSTPSMSKSRAKTGADEELMDDSPPENRSKKSKTPDKKINIPVKRILIILAISVVASVLLIFIFDWTGWKTSLRDDLTTKLIGKEKDILIARLDFEYEQKLKIVKEETLKEERTMLVTEYQELESAKADLEVRMTRLEISEKSFEQGLYDLEAREIEITKKINEYEKGIIEVAELGKIYQAMEPKNAAKILGSISDQNQVVRILKTMKTDSIASILELMETQKAADILSKLN